MASILPPGKEIWPAWSLRCAARCVNSTVGCGRSTTGISTAAGRTGCSRGDDLQHAIGALIATARNDVGVDQTRRNLEAQPGAAATRRTPLN